MHIFLQALAYGPNIAFRPFVTAFLVSMLPLIPYLNVAAPNLPAWFTALGTRIALFVLAGLEISVRKSPDVRPWLHEIEGAIKALVSVVVVFSVVDAQSAALLNTLIGGNAGLGPILSFGWSLFTTAVSWVVDWVRKEFYIWLDELDEDDDLGLQGILSWLEDGGVIAGVVLATLVPLVAIGLFLLTLLGLYLIRLYFERQERKRMVPCARCRTTIHATAPTCYQCGHRTASPRKVGVFGQATQAPVTNLADHKLKLVARKRCPLCAERLKGKGIRQKCATCGTETFADAPAVDRYLRALRQDLPTVLGITFVLGFVPFLGIIPAVIYFRLSLISSLRGYIPRTAGCLTRWGVRLLNLGLIALQPVPVLGMFLLPLMVLSNYYVYQQVLEREKRRVFGIQRDPGRARQGESTRAAAQ